MKLSQTTAANLAVTQACQRRWREIKSDPCKGCPMKSACIFFITDASAKTWETRMSAHLVQGGHHA